MSMASLDRAVVSSGIRRRIPGASPSMTASAPIPGNDLWRPVGGAMVDDMGADAVALEMRKHGRERLGAIVNARSPRKSDIGSYREEEPRELWPPTFRRLNDSPQSILEHERRWANARSSHGIGGSAPDRAPLASEAVALRGAASVESAQNNWRRTQFRETGRQRRIPR